MNDSSRCGGDGSSHPVMWVYASLLHTVSSPAPRRQMVVLYALQVDSYELRESRPGHRVTPHRTALCSRPLMCA